MERTTKGRIKWLKAMLITLGTICLIALFVFQLYPRLGPLPNLTDREIAGATSIASEWLEIKTDPVLRPGGKAPLVILYLEGDYVPDFAHHRLRYPDGSLGAPELELVDDQGNVLPLSFVMASHRDRSGSNDMGGAGFGAPDLFKDIPYVKLRIRSDKPMKCSKIIWRR